MAIESKNLLVWVKAMSRGQALPLDASEVYASLAEAENYAATSAIAYPGQTVKAMTADGKYHSYTLQPSEAGYVLEEVGALKASDLKQFVQVVAALPESGQEEGVLYVNTAEKAGYVYANNAWVKVWWDVTSQINGLDERIDEVEEALDTKAPIANPVFSGTVKVGEDEVAVKSYVDGLIANIVSSAPGIVDSTHALPAEGYKAGQTFRVAEAGTYAGVECETGDLIIVVKDHAEGATADDFMVIQANIDGAVTSSADAATVGEIVVFDSVTGKVIKGSGVQIASLNDAIAKAHEHANKAKLDTYDKTQAELLAAAKSETEALVSAHETAVNTALDGKADKATTLAGYGITDAYNKTEMDGKLDTITQNLNTKITGAEADTKIADALNAKIGDLKGNDTVSERINEMGEIVMEILGDINDVDSSIGYAKHNTIVDAILAQGAKDKAYTDSKIGELGNYETVGQWLGMLKGWVIDNGEAVTQIREGFGDLKGCETVSDYVMTMMQALCQETGLEVLMENEQTIAEYVTAAIAAKVGDIDDFETVGAAITAVNEALLGILDYNTLDGKTVPQYVADAITTKIGDIGDATVKKYIDSAFTEADSHAGRAEDLAQSNAKSINNIAVGIGEIPEGTTVMSNINAIVEGIDAIVGDIPEDTTIKSYIDTAVGSGGTASAQAIATAKQEAITASNSYTDGKLAVVEF